MQLLIDYYPQQHEEIIQINQEDKFIERLNYHTSGCRRNIEKKQCQKYSYKNIASVGCQNGEHSMATQSFITTFGKQNYVTFF